MQTAIEQSEHREQHNGLDRSLDTPNNGSGFFAAYVRPYLGYAATFAAGAVIGAHYFSAEGSTDALEGRGKGQSRRGEWLSDNAMLRQPPRRVPYPPFPCATSPCTAGVFDPRVANFYWTSTVGAIDGSLAWFVNFNSGLVGNASLTDNWSLRAVRGR